MSDLAVSTPQFSHITAKRPTMLGVGTMIWLSSELMFFSALFAAYFTIRAHNMPVWPPPDVHLDVLLSGIATLVLVGSSGTMQMAVWSLEKGNKVATRRWVVLTFVMGCIFISNQAYEWSHLAFSISSNAFGSMFYLMTGFHGLHVILGLLAMIAVLGRLAGPGKDPGEIAVVQSLSYYWHFVDVVWVGLYSTLFLLTLK